jgi:hypothetical protein
MYGLKTMKTKFQGFYPCFGSVDFEEFNADILKRRSAPKIKDGDRETEWK